MVSWSQKQATKQIKITKLNGETYSLEQGIWENKEDVSHHCAAFDSKQITWCQLCT